MIIQMLPGFEEEAVDALEQMLDKMKPLTTYIEEIMLQSAGKTEEGMLEALLEHIFKEMPEQYKPEPLEFKEIKWQCDCNEQRLEQALMTIGRKDLTEILEEDGQAELVFQFCEKKYFFDRKHLEDILSRI
jgi:molecular chaperone Hsp33